MKVLIADDDANARTLLQNLVARFGYEVETVNDGTAALAALQRPDAPQLAILDWIMPGMSGPEICRKIRERSQVPYVYIIVITGMSTMDHQIAGMEAGADDYIAKPLHPDQLSARLSAGRRVVHLQQEFFKARKALEIRAMHDGLTGLLTHAAILERLNNELNRAGRELGLVGVILLDLDHFKEINDAYGHVVGDQVLKESARRMTLAVRSYDIVGRYGGDEFLIVAPGCHAEATVQLAKRVSRQLAATPLITPNGNITITASAGATASRPEDKIEIGSVVELADRALYRAKEAGRNRVEWLIPE